jgi:hypothetical protein
MFRLAPLPTSNDRSPWPGPGTPVAVKIDLEDHSLRLEVWNVMPLDEPQVPGEPATNGERPGHGLAGMRERVSLLRGRRFAGEVEDGFFLVSATLPSTNMPLRWRAGRAVHPTGRLPP